MLITSARSSGRLSRASAWANAPNLREAVGRTIGMSDESDPAMAKLVQVVDDFTHRADVIGINVVTLRIRNEKRKSDAGDLPGQFAHDVIIIAMD